LRDQELLELDTAQALHLNVENETLLSSRLESRNSSAEAKARAS
jgi:hypothetical protein